MNAIFFLQNQKEELHKRIIYLEKDLDKKQAIELEIERLRGSLNVMKHIEDEGDLEVLNKVDGLHKMLREKEGELEDWEKLNQALIIQERKSNEELQDARKELTNVTSSPIAFFILFHNLELNASSYVSLQAVQWPSAIFSCFAGFFFFF